MSTTPASDAVSPKAGMPAAASEAAGGSGRARAVLDWLVSRSEELVGFTAELARRESPSGDVEGCLQVFDLLQGELESLDWYCRRLPGRESAGCLYARPRRGPEREAREGVQVLLGHADTVWPRGTLQTMPVRRRDGLLLGPGVYDMKAGLAQAIWALKALRATDPGAADVDLPLCPVLLVTSDEEVGSEESRRTLQRLARVARRVFVLEPSLGRDGRLKTSRKGVGHYRVRVRGRAAHAGLDPEQGASAILELSHVVQKLFALNDPGRGTTVNVGKIDGGLRTNVVAAESRAWVDVRVRSLEEAERVEEAMRALETSTPGTSLQVEGELDRPPMEPTPGNRALWRSARELGRELGLELEEAAAGGASDGNFTSLQAPTLDGLGAVGEGAHADHEQVRVEKMPERAALLALLLASPPRASDREEGEGEESTSGESPAPS